jgi:hypothetical protein
MEDNMFHIRDIQQLKVTLQSAVLKRWMHPAIDYVNEDTETVAEFIIRDSFVGNYLITIRKES